MGLSRFPRTVRALAGAALAALLAVPLHAQLIPADATSEGDWPGSWLYTSRDQRFALFLRHEDGRRPEIRVQFENPSRRESFASDWNGVAEYFIGGLPARFELKVVEGDRDRIVGSWSWDLPVSGRRERESGEVTLYRTGDGRRMRLHGAEIRRIRYESDDRETDLGSFPLTMTFVKRSKRIVRWEELPF